MASSSSSAASERIEPKGIAEPRVRAGYPHDQEDEYEMNAVVASKWQGTEADRRDMSQLGKVQELRV